MKIDAPKIKVSRKESPLVLESGRFVRESDWRKIIAVVKAVEQDDKDGRLGTWSTCDDKLDALRKHLEKRRARSKT